MRHIITLRLANGDEVSLPSLTLPPIIVIGEQTTGASIAPVSPLAAFANKSFMRIDDTLVYEEVSLEL